MIQSRPNADITRVGPLAAIALAAALTVGFVAGQAAPDVLGNLFGSAATVESVSPDAPALTQLDDYGIRHLNDTPLTPADDYGVRHP